MGYALRELRRRKWRTATTGMGYALAAGVVVLLLGLLWQQGQASSRILRSTGTHFIAFTPATCDPNEGCLKRLIEPNSEGFVAGSGVRTSVMAMELVARAKRIGAVKDASPYLLFRFQHPLDGHLFTLGGIDSPQSPAVATTCCAPGDLLAGRFLRDDDQNVVMVEEAYARARKLGVGQKVVVAGEPLEIVGVVNPGIRPAKADIYALFGLAQRLVNKRMLSPLRDEFGALLVEAASAQQQDEAIAAVKQLGGGLVSSTYACYRPAVAVLGINAQGAWVLGLAVAIGALLLGAKTQLSAVAERRRDIGVLKAIGWSNGHVVRMIVAESAIVAVVGGVVGGLVGAGVMLCGVTGVADVRLPVTLVAGLFGAGVCAAAIGGIVASVAPALVASRTSPGKALRGI
jgi:putative ABC transport system permease protein